MTGNDGFFTVPALNLGSVDAINYKTREEKEFFSKIIYRDMYLEEILDRKKYFLIGEKGTGKTSYAVFLNNNEYKNTLSRVTSLSQTDYQRFISLTEKGNYGVSSYVDIWKVILLLLCSDGLSTKFESYINSFPAFHQLRQAIEAYYHSAFKPEVGYSLDIIENSEHAAKLIGSFVELGGKKGKQQSSSFPSFQVALSYLEKNFKDAIKSVKIEKNFVLFIDGIDIRPNQIEFETYIECIRGLANAAWDLNTEFFSNIKDSKGSIKIVLLMRPDIMDNMSFQNLNSKVHDNGVVLNWITSYDNFDKSALFYLVSGTLSKQQLLDTDEKSAWEHYFPYEIDNMRLAGVVDNPFVGLLRYSFYRPRDIIQYLKLMQDYVSKEENNKLVFSRESFFKRQREFSDYLLGEVKDYLSFYYSTVDFDEIVGFFSLFGGRNHFTWESFQRSFEKHRTRTSRNPSLDGIASSAEDFLQFLYSLNIIGYMEPDEWGGNFIHYCFRDRTTVKLRPKVKFGLKYQVHAGLQRALLVGGAGRQRHHRRVSQRRTSR